MMNTIRVVTLPTNSHDIFYAFHTYVVQALVLWVFTIQFSGFRAWLSGLIVRFNWQISLIYAWSMVDMWPLRGLGVRYGSTNQANSAFHPFGVGKWVVISVITWITEVETIKRQTGTVCGCLAVRLARVCGLCLQPIDCTICTSLWWTVLQKLQLQLL